MKPFLKFLEKFSKGDIVIIVLIFLIGVSAMIGFYRRPSGGEIVRIYVDAKEYGAYSFSESFQKDVEIRTEYGYNKLRIENGTVFVWESDCGNQDCIHMGSIEKPGDILICLPHKLLIRLEGGGQIEAVSY